MSDRFFYTLSLFIIINCVIIGQEGEDSKNFIPPVNHPLRLAGTFGELRTNHFHMGLDIKSSNGISGDPVYAAAGGYVSRISVNRSGYGNAIYIDHPSGYTTVYGHLHNFNKAISEFIKGEQYRQQSFEINYYTDSTQFIIAQGELIGNMGNTGSSAGPHLHFEIRDKKTEMPLNPMKFGLTPPDETPPTIIGLKFIHLDDKLHEVNSETYTLKKVGNNEYKLSTDKVTIPAWRIGIAVDAIDPMNNNHNKNGIYSIKMIVDGEKVFFAKFDSISFDDTRFLNAFIDYKEFISSKKRYLKLFPQPGNHLPLVEATAQSIISLYKEKPRSISLELSDFAGNISYLKFTVLRHETINPPIPKAYNYYLEYNVPNFIELETAKLYIPENTFYEHTYLYAKTVSDIIGNQEKEIVHIGKKDIPLHHAATLYMKPLDYQEKLRNKLIITDCTNPNYLISYGGNWVGENLVAEINEFGSFSVDIDTVPPSITILSDLNNLKTRNSISFKIEDNYYTKGNARGLQYNASIDGSWVLFSYDLKTKTIQHLFEQEPDGKNHELILEVWDDKFNKAVFTKNFVR